MNEKRSRVTSSGEYREEWSNYVIAIKDLKNL